MLFLDAYEKKNIKIHDCRKNIYKVEVWWVKFNKSNVTMYNVEYTVLRPHGIKVTC